MATRRRRGFSPLAGLLFQAGIVLLGLLPLLVFNIPVATHGLTAGDYLFWGTLAGLLTYGVLLILSLVDALSSDSLMKHIRELHRFVCSQRWSVLVGLAVLAGIGEELLFRGVIQGWVSQHLGVVAGILAGALVFGLAHAMSLAYFLVASALGVVFGVAYAVTDSLQLVMVWHAVYDLVVIAVLRWYPQLFGLRTS
ncbi:CPBP family intramembrane glutamic endopeptidase [Marinobacter zhanjiangensis]|uniref:CPBP family intramembrane glutamic endopeptidase n=1 Tax=Marinobacter zhanjiangensis TaxID=578215 RepID=UPI00167A0215|nr:type II CAAX endopeptidase family protein [Marinobacter zhanjiangensis]